MIAVYFTRHMCLECSGGEQFDPAAEKISFVLIHSAEAEIIIGGKKGCETRHES